MIKKIIIFAICTVALAGANCISVFAAESTTVSGNDVSVVSESEQLGSFGNDDGDYFQDFLNFLESLRDLGFDLSADEDSDVELSDDSFIYPSDPDDPVVQFDELSDDYGINLYSNYVTYPSGTIAEPFVTYFRGYLPKLHWNQHYLLFRSNEGVLVGSNYVYGYVYYFVVGDNLSVSGGTFTGSDVTVYRMYYYNSSYNSFGVTTQSTFSLSQSGGSFVFTDLDSNYPSLESLSDRTSRQILYALVIGFLITFVSKLYYLHWGRKNA